MSNVFFKAYLTVKVEITMDSLNLTGNTQLFFGIYLIIHGLIHSLFLMYSLNEDKQTYTGWSGKSWLLDNFFDSNLVDIIGKTIWILIIILFIISGAGILGLPIITDYKEPLIIFTSVLAIFAFIIFFNGLYPTPYHYLIGLSIDIVLIVFVAFYPSEHYVASMILGILFVIGLIFVFISDVVPMITNASALNTK